MVVQRENAWLLMTSLQNLRLWSPCEAFPSHPSIQCGSWESVRCWMTTLLLNVVERSLKMASLGKDNKSVLQEQKRIMLN